MKRRTYLATATAVALGGCMGNDDSEEESETNSTATSADPSDSSDDDSADTGDAANGEDDADGDDEEQQQTNDVPVGTFDDFEDLSNWTTIDGGASLDDEKASVGDHSVRLETEMMDHRVIISHEFDEPADLTDVVPGMAVASDELVVPTIQVFDEDRDRIDYRRGVKGDVPFMRYNFGVGDVEGDPDLSRVTEMRVLLWTERLEQRRFWIDDFHFLPRPETGKVMIQFDDTHDTDHTVGLPALEEYGYPASTFINPDRVGRSEDTLTVEQLEELSDAGWTIASHTLSHPDLTELDAAEQEREIVDSKEWLVDHGFEDGAEYFAYPFGEYDETTLDLVEEHYELGFAGGLPVQGYAANPLVCTRIGDPSAERATEMLDRTADMRGITTMFYHRLEGERLEDFETMIEHLHELESAGELEIITPEDLEDELQISF